ncbi:4-galactosyl-N-acetylglucosaminide 3-alpha-L-fucosyltransferase FUT6-like [Daphnia pulex]|uniref:4-galactosyl-N-acetylglucosaminide 3-alpha-L-fucosyltransferase FUT6-like n=1 Tax=Daphnia pulex TaxID=6669 RepID=UPI001EDFABF2|nr:4-galactosyl-N-acetylglucosaminide 3-alpha-L-fucosyltransferase FUT6-like [Daphnia pulex]XP_046454715.1 4-galactosyl-N-acetylglucosaminide 3-alpha-L-fucosyltransferase FUT6-like [Daphnia pulex]
MSCRRCRFICRARVPLLLAIISAVMAIFTVAQLFWQNQQSLPPLSVKPSQPLTSTSSISNNSKLKIILYWSSWSWKMGDQPLIKAKCPVTACLFTPDLTLFNQSDVVVISVETTPDFLVNRLPHQRFVFFVMESPANTVDIPMLRNNQTRYNYFNWTMSYRRDSDIVLRDFLGAVVSKNNSNDQYPPRIETNVSRRQYNSNTTRKLSSVDALKHLVTTREDRRKADKNPFVDESRHYPWIKSKTKLVAWFVSHCDTPIQREEYARQLGQHIPVDIYGRCGKEHQVTSICDSADDPANCEEIRALRAQYKFYLAFENSWCPDYVTEKFYRTLQFDTVPIVLGGAEYDRFAPPHSFINALDFSSPKQLAEYLLLLNSSEELYAGYFQWKNHYRVSLPAMDGWCDLCRMAHDETLPAKVYPDIKQWWIDDGPCENDRTNYF